jgi:MscS family membrane protein
MNKNEAMTKLFRILGLLGLILLQNLSLQAQTDSLKLNLSSPRNTVYWHLYYLQQDSYDPPKAAEALFEGELSLEKREDIAIQLVQIFDGTAHFIELEDIPANPNYVDSTTNTAIYRVYPEKYPEIVVRKYGDQWLYSQKTVKRVPRIHDEIFPPGSEFLLNLLPRVGKSQFLGLQFWQYLGMLLLVVVAALLYKLLDILLGWGIRRLLPRIFPDTTLAQELIPPVAHPLSLLFVLALVRWFLPALLLPPDGLGKYLLVVFNIMIPVFGVVVVYRLVDVFTAVFSSLAGKTETTMDDQLVPLLSKASKLIVVVLGIIFILDNLEVDVTALLAGVSIGGLALALAAQDTVKNFIGSISIFVDQPFTIGDFIDTGSLNGVVTEVGVRSTRLRAPDGAMVSIPNGQMADAKLTNHGVRTYRRYATTLGLTYGTPVAKIKTFVERIREIVEAHPATRKEASIIYFDTLADSSLNITFIVYFELTAYDQWLAARQDVLMDVLAAAEDIGVDFAFPSTSVYVEQMPGKG